MLYRMPYLSLTIFANRMVYLFCAVRKLIFCFWYNLEKNVTCPDRVLILQITGVLMVYIVADHYLAYFCFEAVKLQAVSYGCL
jgi:hypothetical protein